MTRYNLCNLTFVSDKYFKPFSIDSYTFTSKYSFNSEDDFGCKIITSTVEEHRRHKLNAFVTFKGKQKDSLIWKGGRVGLNEVKSRKRKLIEDILLISSLLVGKNVFLHSRKRYPQCQLVSSPHLNNISKNSFELQSDLTMALNQLKDNKWRKKFHNGFHLIMMYNHANVLLRESRYLANVIIWEWLYPQIHPSGRESLKLKEIFLFLLEYFYPSRVNSKLLKSNNIFHVLRNQLAHSGMFPIDRPYAEDWMKQLSELEIQEYLKFFGNLTHAVVLKTLGIDVGNRLDTFDFSSQLSSYLRTGRIFKS